MSEEADLQRIVVDLEAHPDTVRGWVGYVDDEATAFHGWLELASHLERLRPRPDVED